MFQKFRVFRDLTAPRALTAFDAAGFTVICAGAKLQKAPVRTFKPDGDQPDRMLLSVTITGQ